jgi:type I restriction enzyme M protein
MLLEKCQLEAVVSMPSGVFQPYAGVSTAVLVFVKGGKTENVWFYEMLKDGYSLDQKRDFIDGKGDIPNIIEMFRKRKEATQSIVVPIDRITKNNFSLSISQYKEIEQVQIDYENPVQIIDQVMTSEEEILKDLDELKKMIE